MKKTNAVLLGIGLLLLVVGVLGATLGTDINAKEAINRNFSSASQMSGWKEDAYGGMMGNRNGRAYTEDYSEADRMDVESLENIVEDYIASYEEALEIADVFIFSDTDYYYSVIETDSGMGAMELLVNPYTGNVYQEYGPDMMWNVKYGMMGGQKMIGYSGMIGGQNMMGYGGMMNNQSMMAYEGMMGNQDMMGYERTMGNQNNMGYDATMSDQTSSGQWPDNTYATNGDIEVNVLSVEEAISEGNDYLTGRPGGYSLGDSYHEFYGYFTFHIESEGETSGMLSVNAFNGDVWLHDWHGELTEIIGSHEADVH